MATTTKNPAPHAISLADAVTVHSPFTLGASNLFAVQGGVLLSDAMDAMALLLGTAHTAACEGAIASDNDGGNGGASWAVEHLLTMARALNSSIHSGLVAAQRGNDTSGRA